MRVRRAFIKLPVDHALFSQPVVELRPGVFERRLGDMYEILYRCQDCGGVVHTVMLQDHLWEQTGYKSGMACAHCIEKRLGRKLTADDLKDCGWKNEVLFWARRLA